jgi:hypothetical protein
MNRSVIAMVAAGVLAVCAIPAGAAVPSPQSMTADVVTSGRTTTALKIDTASVGQTIPRTFSGDKVKNTPGFSWYVSRHYALKTDYPAEKATFYLELLEQAYPHYVEFFGREPAGTGDKRMAVCYASSAERLRDALKSDGLTWDFGGGGITFEGHCCSYVYPSGSLQYHQRYILLHECTHLFQMALTGTVYDTPAWYYESTADALASHVYDQAARRLTVEVLDKPTTHDYFDEGMAELARSPLTAEAIHDGAGGRGVAYLFFHFLSDDPDRAQIFRLWREAMPRAAARDRCLAASSRLLTELLGPWKNINADFKAWLASIHHTFHYAEWGWEQDGDTLWSYGFAKNGKLSETDILLPPGEKAVWSHLRMDWPVGPTSPLVSSVTRGSDEPTVGCLVDFSLSPATGRAGLGLGVIAGTGEPSGEPKPEATVTKTGGVTVISLETLKPAGPAPGYLAVLINEERELIMDGTGVGAGYRSAALPKALRDAAATSHQFCLTIQITKAGLEITVRARQSAGTEIVAWKNSWPVPASVRERILKQPLAVLSRDGRHGVTPYADDARRPEPNLAIPAPPNRWRNPGDRQLAALYRAAWRLKEKTPASLTALKQAMLAAVGDPRKQTSALAEFNRQISVIMKDLESSGAPADAIKEVLVDLATASGQVVAAR